MSMELTPLGWRDVMMCDVCYFRMWLLPEGWVHIQSEKPTCRGTN